MSSATIWHLWRRVLTIACAAVLLCLGGSLAWLKWHERELIFRAAQSHLRVDGTLPSSAESLTIRAVDGTALAALVLRADRAHDSGYWVLHLHGNADSAFSPGQLHHCEQLSAAGFSVLAFDYRGFGRSPGVPSERHLTEDAEAAYEALIVRGVAPSRIIIWGHSLGSAPAVQLAVRHPQAAALVLFGAFTSIADAAADNYPYLPVRYIAGVHMESLGQMRAVHIPVVVAHSVHDRVISYRHALRLYAAANSPKRLLSLDLPTSDGLGGHVNALYQVLPSFALQLLALIHAGSVPAPERSGLAIGTVGR